MPMRRMVFDANGVLTKHTFNGIPQPLILSKTLLGINGGCKKHRSIPLLDGPGTELKKLLSKFGLKPAASCKCNQHIRAMNQKGVEWCVQNIDTIVGWLKEESERSKLPFTSIGARIIVRRAIRNAKKKGAGITV